MKIEIIALILCFISALSLDVFFKFLNPDFAIFFRLLTFVLLASFLYLFVKIFLKLPKAENKKTVKQQSLIESLFFTNDPLLILRFFAAFCVFSTHTFLLLQPPFFNELIQGCAHSGMVIFFTLSGYLMGKAFVSARYSFSRQGILSFYRNRFLRIVPLAFSFFLLALIFVYPEKIKSDLVDFWRILFFAFHGSVDILSIPGISVLWSLSIEMQYYLIAPFIFYALNGFLSKPRNALLFILLCCVIGYSNLYFAIMRLNGNLVIFFSLLGQLPYFLIGFAMNFLVKNSSSKVKKISRGLFYLKLSETILLLVSCFIAFASLQKKQYFLTLTLAAIATCFLIIHLEKIKPLAQDFSQRINLYTILQSLGVLSYGFYLWHCVVIIIYNQKTTPLFPNFSQYLSHCGLIFLITITLSFCSYCLIEFKFITKKRRVS